MAAALLLTMPSYPLGKSSRGKSTPDSSENSSPLTQPHSALTTFGPLLDVFVVKKSHPLSQGRSLEGHSGDGSGAQQQRLRKEAKDKRVDRLPTRKSDLYENCRLMVRERLQGEPAAAVLPLTSVSLQAANKDLPP